MERKILTHEGSAIIQKQLFDELLKNNKQHLLGTLTDANDIEFIYEVVPPIAEKFFIVSYSAAYAPTKREPALDMISLLAVDLSGQIVGFSVNEVKDSNAKVSQSDGVIATTKSRHYYGYGLEVARRDFLQEIASRKNKKIIHTIKEHSSTKTENWEYFFSSNQGPFSMVSNKEKSIDLKLMIFHRTT